MRSLLKTLTIFLLMALIPMRAAAAVTIGMCPSGHEGMAAAQPAEHAHAAGEHEHGGDDTTSNSPEPSCNVCAEHCSSAAFAPSVNGAPAARPFSAERTHLAERSAPAAVPDQLDRPPLA